MSRAELLAFDRNVVLRAGAGTGKTEALASLYVHLVAGATKLGRPVAPERIVAVTFTEKAANEMRERIERALRALAAPEPVGAATPVAVREVLQTFRERGDAPPGEDVFRSTHACLDAARITTLHSLCASVLRRFTAEAKLDPSFIVLDADESARLFEEAAIGAVRELLRGREPALGSLVEDVGGLRGAPDGGLLRLLASLHLELSETGRDVDALVEGTPLSPAGATRCVRAAADRLGMTESDVEAGRLHRAWEALVTRHAELARMDAHHATMRKFELVAEIAENIRRRAVYGTDDADALLEASQELSRAFGKSRGRDEPGPRDAREAVHELWLLPRARSRAGAILALLRATRQRYAESKRARSMVDFADLSLRARDLLRDREDVRRTLAGGIDALLVDEFQDTNAVQRDLVLLLRTRGDIAAGREPSVEQIHRTGLFVVGDRKQSIYGFRGADVGVFERLARELCDRGALECALTTSYRTVQPLTEALNALASEALRPRDDAQFALEFDRATEALEAVRAGPPDAGACVEVLALGDQREDDALAEPEAIARRAVELVTDTSTARVGDGAGGWRPPRFGDMAILLPRFTHLADYLRALDAWGAPYLVVGGRGIFATVEARDVLSLVRVLVAEDDGRGIAALLRGPMTHLSDAALLAVADACGGHGGWCELLHRDLRLSGEVPAGERERYRATTHMLARLRDVVDRIGLAGAVRLALEQTGYAAIAAALPSGRQRVANVDRIVSEIAQREAAGEDGRSVARDLLRRARRGADEPEADVATDTSDAIRVMTVHQSKGLEFPIVFAGDLGRTLEARTRAFVFDREPGARLAVAVRDGSDRWVYGAHVTHVSEIRRKRERAEQMRLFYVQMTRARDRLVLSGVSRGVMRDVVEPIAASLGEQGLLAILDVAGAPPPARRATDVAPARVIDDAEAVELVRRAGPVRARVATLEVPVTQLEDFGLCPRRFRARHVLRLPEHPAPRVPEELGPGDEASSESARERGTRAHRALERLDLALAATDPDRAIERALGAAGASGDRNVARRLRPFVIGPYVARLARLDGASVEREVPFALALEAGVSRVVVRGQIDLVVHHGGGAEEHGIDVVDYKVTRPRVVRDPTVPYRFQLDAYALAVARAYPTARRVRAGVQFLDGRSRLPVFGAGGRDASEEARAERLSATAAAFLEARSTSRFEGRERAYCEDIRCGYVGLCHGVLLST